MKKTPLILLVALGCITPSPRNHAVGFRLPNQDPEAIARGNAYTATADNPSAVYYNPAGITQLEGHNLRSGLYAIAAHIRYRGVESTSTKDEVQLAPQLYYVYSPEESRVSAGLGIYAPYGLGLEWPEDSGFRTLAMEGRLAYVRINPVIAVEVHPTLSLAVGPTFNLTTIDLRQGIFAPGDEFRFKGWGAGYGYTAGLLWRPHEKWSFGVSYHSATDITYDGRSKAKPYTPSEDTKGDVPFPQFVMAGISFRPNPNWNIEVDVDYADWATMDTLFFEKDSGDIPFPLNWRSSWMYGIGVTRYFPNGYWVGAGYFFSENSVPDRNFNPSVPDADQHVLSLGVGAKGSRWSWAVAYQLLFSGWRNVRDSQSTSLIGESADGKYQIFNNALNLTVGYHF